MLDDGSEVFLTASLGLAIGDGPDADVLLRNADAAMYRAKELGRDRLEVFDEEMQEAAVARLNLGNDLRRAIERRRSSSCSTSRSSTCAPARSSASEALVRWAHPERGLHPRPTSSSRSPRTPASSPRSAGWVLDAALADAGRWAEHHDLGHFTQAVNLSARQLTTEPHRARGRGRSSATSWPAERLCLELTESVLMDDLDVTLDGAAQPEGRSACGWRSTTSAPATRRSPTSSGCPVDVVKIDQSFVSGLSPMARRADDDRGTIATAVIGIAHALGLAAVAEGVENEQQLAVLRKPRLRPGAGLPVLRAGRRRRLQRLPGATAGLIRPDRRPAGSAEARQPEQQRLEEQLLGRVADQRLDRAAGAPAGRRRSVAGIGGRRPARRGSGRPAPRGRAAARRCAAGAAPAGGGPRGRAAPAPRWP